MSRLPYSINFSLHVNADLYEAWFKEKSALKINEIVTLFRWDTNDGKIENTEEGFNNYLLDLFKSDLTKGWSLSSEVDPFKLLPLEIQGWYHGLYYHNQELLLDSYSWDDRTPDLNLADYVKEIYEDEEKRAEWSISMPDTSNDETTYTWSVIEWLLEDCGNHESRQEYLDECKDWRQKPFKEFKKELINLMLENQHFEEQFIEEYGEYDGNEEDFIRNIDFKELYDFLKTDYNGWPQDMT
ncbi:hypothetical protein SynA15127_01466 [Synechococcus sp. A15-127]|uniref:hypothetical protein n=1 Tax=Synechococcus sp. A15-127 TaxID=1050624 RepID=UPI0016453D38|nr:hypothetical protein [Synechococcus sp. A15-127]QNI94544.1 hypothetical protein SynA15127_01466 [Synechococcus sp. A15-127]